MPYFDVAFGYTDYCQCDAGGGITITYYVDEDKANKQLMEAEESREAPQRSWYQFQARI